MPNRGYIWTIVAAWAVTGFCFGHCNASGSENWGYAGLIAWVIAHLTYHELRRLQVPCVRNDVVVQVG